MLFIFFFFFFFFFNDTATTEIYTVMNTLSLHDALPISPRLDDERGWIERLVTKRQKLRRSARRLEMPRMVTRTCSRPARLAFARHFLPPKAFLVVRSRPSLERRS